MAAEKPKKKTIRQKLLAKVHIAKKEMGLDDDTYRELLFTAFRVRSAKDLTDIQLTQLLDIFRECGWQQDKNKRYPDGFGRKKYENLGKRKGFASPKQLRLIEALWDRVSRAKDKEAALRKFLENRFHVSHIKFLSDEKASRVIDALKDMFVRKAFYKACEWHGFSKEEAARLRKIFWNPAPDGTVLKEEVLHYADMKEARVLAAESPTLLIEVFYELLNDFK